MSSQEIARRGSVPPALVDAGVKISEVDGIRVVEIPDELRKVANVLLPVSQMTQADPNWSPSFRMVKLDPTQDGPHFYPQTGGRLAPRKEALGLLGELAGIDSITTARIPKDELAETELFGIRATLTIRLSDGRVKSVTATKTFDREVELKKIQRDVAKSDKTGDQAKAEIEKRWLAEREHGPRKVETKAIEAAQRELLHIPHTFTKADAEKPFLVVGYAFTPDTSDPEIRRLVIEAGFSAARQLYPSEPQPAVEQPALEHPAAASPAAGSEAAAPAHDGPAFEGQEPPPPGESTTSDGDTGPDAEDEAAVAAAREAASAGLLEISFGQYQGVTIEELATERKRPDYVIWMADEMKATRPDARTVKAAAKAYADFYLRGDVRGDQ